MARRHQDALQAHDTYGPVNPSGVMHSFVKAYVEARSEGKADAAIKTDSAIQLLALSVDSLVFAEQLEDPAAFATALKSAQRLGGERYLHAVDAVTTKSTDVFHLANLFIAACRETFTDPRVESARTDNSVRLIALAIARELRISPLRSDVDAYRQALDACSRMDHGASLPHQVATP